MKKYLMFLAAFALLLVGCAQNEIVENRSEKNAIGFRNLNDRQTRAANEDDQDYGVYTHWTGSTDWYMTDQLVDGKDKGNGVDYYTPKRYWPTLGTVKFFAYAPHSTIVGGGTKTITDTTVGALTIDYTVPADAHEDFTVAKAVTVDVESDDTSTPVALEFKHMLSKVEVGAVLDGGLDDFVLNLDKATVEIIVTENKRQIDLTKATQAWEDTYAAGSTSATYNHPFTGITKDGDGKITAVTNPHFIFMPQPSWVDAVGSDPATSKVSIQLKGVRIYNEDKIYWGDETDGSPLKKFEFTANLLDGGNDFLPNTLYKVTFTIKNGATGGDDKPVFGNAIEFSSSISPWAEKTVSFDQPDGVNP